MTASSVTVVDSNNNPVIVISPTADQSGGPGFDILGSGGVIEEAVNAQGVPYIALGATQATLDFFLQFVASGNTDAPYVELYSSQGGDVSLQMTHKIFQLVSGLVPGGLAFDATTGTLKFTNGAIPSQLESWHVPTLLNGWTQTSGYNTIAYRKMPSGNVEFKGTIHAGTFSDSTALFNLPTSGTFGSYAPAKQVLMHPSLAPSGAGFGGSARLYVNTSGQVQIYGASGGAVAPTDICFDGCFFSLLDS